MNEHIQDTTIDMEKTREHTAIVVGRMGELGLGNPDGIPSSLSNATQAELNECASRAAEKLVPVNDLRACACIDGRQTKCNADGSSPQDRLRRVGGSASNFGVALNAGASVVETLPSDASLEEQTDIIDAYITDLTGLERSAHKGGCGGANGEVDDNEAINTNPNILAAVKAFMDIPEVREELGVGYDDALGERVRVNAGKTAAFQRLAGWNGQVYVDKVESEKPQFVEELAVDVEDEKFHGHKEASIRIIIGNETDKEDDNFVWNLKASKMIAKALAGQRGQEGYTQVLIAEIAKHFSVANRLASIDTPIFILASK